jgi:hypothetical protein
MKAVKDDLKNVVSKQKRHRSEKLPLSLLDHRTLTSETRVTTPASTVFGRRPSVLSDLPTKRNPIRQRD